MRFTMPKKKISAPHVRLLACYRPGCREVVRFIVTYEGLNPDTYRKYACELHAWHKDHAAIVKGPDGKPKRTNVYLTPIEGSMSKYYEAKEKESRFKP